MALFKPLISFFKASVGTTHIAYIFKTRFWKMITP